MGFLKAPDVVASLIRTDKTLMAPSCRRSFLLKVIFFELSSAGPLAID